jgi:hypothetical protein
LGTRRAWGRLIRSKKDPKTTALQPGFGWNIPGRSSTAATAWKICSLAGADTINAFAGNDTLNGIGGNDT